MTELLLITSDYPPRLGGVATYYGTLTRQVPGLEVLTNVVGAEGQNVHRTSYTWPGWPKWLPLMWVVPSFWFKLKPRLLAAGELLPTGIALLLMYLAFGWPYAVFVHGLDVQLAQRNPWKRALARQVLGRARVVFANSNYTRDLALSAGAREVSAVVLYPAILAQAAQPAAVEALSRRYHLQGKRVLLTVSRLVARKGIGDVLSAVSELQKEFADLVYVVVGEGPELDKLKAQSSKIKTNVIFTGPVSEEERAAWYEICELFVLTPQPDAVDVEGFGIVYLEAQAAGKPVVGSNVGGVPEAVGPAGLLVNSPTELVGALRRLLADRALAQRLGELGQARVASDFTPHGQAEKFNRHIKNLNS